jgi:hypothetical protein
MIEDAQNWGKDTKPVFDDHHSPAWALERLCQRSSDQLDHASRM